MLTQAALSEFFITEFPHASCTIEALGEMSATVRQEVSEHNLRPGNTVSGPTLMAVADIALYAAILGEIGLVPLAVTTSLNINFLSKPAAGAAIIGKCSLLKVGRTLAVGEVTLYSEGSDIPVAHATGTYAIPQPVKGS